MGHNLQEEEVVVEVEVEVPLALSIPSYLASLLLGSMLHAMCKTFHCSIPSF